MLAVAPELPDLWREAAELRAEIGEMRSALQALDRLLLLPTTPSAATRWPCANDRDAYQLNPRT